ncbi:Ankyrin repeat domain-containing protein [Plasmodiophora brassicae]
MGNTAAGRSDVDSDDVVRAAFEQGDDDRIREVVCSQRPMRDGQSYLHLAAQYDRVDTAKWLIDEQDGNPNHKDSNGVSPTHVAAREGHLPLLLYFAINADADLFAVDINGYTPFLHAVQGGHLPCCKFLRDRGAAQPGMLLSDGRSCVHLCAQQGHIIVLKWICEALPDVHADRPDKASGMTPLLMASSQGHATVVDYLIQHCHADPHATDNRERNALHHAALNDHVDVARYLVEQACLDPGARDCNDKAPVDYAGANVSAFFNRPSSFL